MKYVLDTNAVSALMKGRSLTRFPTAPKTSISTRFVYYPPHEHEIPGIAGAVLMLAGPAFAHHSFFETDARQTARAQR